MTTFTVQVNSKSLDAQLKRLLKQTNDLTPFFATVGEELQADIKGFFNTGTGADGKPWQPLTPLSQANKDARKRGKKVLVDTGSLQQQVNYDATASKLTIFNTQVYAAIHHFGGPVKRGSSTFQMPSRPFMPADINGKLYPFAKKVIDDRLQLYIDQSINK